MGVSGFAASGELRRAAHAATGLVGLGVRVRVLTCAERVSGGHLAAARAAGGEHEIGELRRAAHAATGLVGLGFGQQRLRHVRQINESLSEAYQSLMGPY
jgi:hypothetical protein